MRAMRPRGLTPWRTFAQIKSAPFPLHNSLTFTFPLPARMLQTEADPDEEPMEIAFKVEGMMCDGCVETVTAVLTGTGKVQDVKAGDPTLNPKP